jgi:hypothetical protein
MALPQSFIKHPKRLMYSVTLEGFYRLDVGFYTVNVLEP